jgi:hypothetical protein
MEASLFLGLLAIAFAAFLGLGEIANAIRNQRWNVTLPDPITVTVRKGD